MIILSGEITILISIAALIVSIFSLGWNFYRDLILKARIRVTAQITHIHHNGEIHGPYISITVTNLGPGPGTVTIESIQMAKMSCLRFLGRPLLKLLGKENRYAHIMYDYTNPYSSKLPAKINVGDKLTLPLLMNKDSSISCDPSHLGVLDSFGRCHWATKHSLKRTKKEYFSEYDKKHW